MIDRDDISVEDMHALMAIFTHEIRTGLNAAIGFAHLIAQDDRLPGSTIEDATVIKQSAQNTIVVCNDYLEIFIHLLGKKRPSAATVSQLNLQELIDICLVAPVRDQVEKQNVRQRRQQARYRAGQIDEAELAAIRYVMNLMNSSLDAYFAPTLLAERLRLDLPDDALLLTLPAEPVAQILNNLHLLAEGFGAVRRQVEVRPRLDEVLLVLTLTVPRRNRRDCELALAFWTELQQGVPFQRHFENRRLAVLDLWRRQIPADLHLAHRPDSNADEPDRFTIALTLPIESA